MTDLGTLGGVASWAVDINDAGQIVGGYRTEDSTPTGHANLWENGIKTDLGTLGGTASGVDAINNRGQIVGGAQTAVGAYRPFVWEGGVMYDLYDLLPAASGWDVTRAANINDHGQIAGTGLFICQERAFLASDSNASFADGGLTITSLGTLCGSGSSAGGINNLGQVVCWSGTKDCRSHAFRYSGGVMTDLKTLLGNPTVSANYSSASAINDGGQVVGSSVYDPSALPYPSYHAVTWQGGKISDLNKQLPRGSAWRSG